MKKGIKFVGETNHNVLGPLKCVFIAIPIYIVLQKTNSHLNHSVEIPSPNQERSLQLNSSHLASTRDHPSASQLDTGHLSADSAASAAATDVLDLALGLGLGGGGLVRGGAPAAGVLGVGGGSGGAGGHLAAGGVARRLSGSTGRRRGGRGGSRRSATDPDGRAGHGVAGVGAAPDAVSESRVLGGVHAGDLGGRAGDAGAAAGDAELGALHVELRLADVVLVDGDVLEADEVLAVGDVLGDGELHAVLLPGAPGLVDVGGTVLGAALPDLEPVAVAHVGGDVGGGLGHVDHAGAGVLDELVEPELGADLVAGLDVHGLCGGAEGALVAAEVLGVDDLGGEGGLVVVGVLADVVVVAAHELVVDNQLGEDVVARDLGRCQQRRGEGVERLGEHVVGWVGFV
jgi:hypothetical protein